ncbi:hydroxyacid dehydrogenase [Pelomicrobium methylotrophicum]|uniref:Hydroxyacid dehydrogenase n=1 Tax=Pelomicrobium methylotrophicum TaxID=2602750 RepID=A0A5C7F0V6_9PROT|nr:hydroxyacid dehydrogenase [Pelomicrobium methylotrophicum]TXF13134.1 hydroxyacid dehydrogenase [Pelomicrobium methylotrophicum]
MNIVISEFMDETAVDALRADFSVIYEPTLVEERSRLLSLAKDADALIVRNRTRVDEALLSAAQRLKVVGRLGVGLDNIDVAACRARAVEVIPASGANAAAVAEYVIGTAMALLRGQYASTDAVIDGEWPRTTLSGGRELGGKTLGLIGCGHIGRLTARLARALGMQVVAYDPALRSDDPALAEIGIRRVELAELLSTSDVVSLHVPLTDKTRALLNRQQLSAMKKGAILVNTARGGIVDEQALVELLTAGHLGGAAIDVFAQEPLPAGSPFAALKGAPNLILTPHVAGVTRESNERVSAMIAERVAEHLSRHRG